MNVSPKVDCRSADAVDEHVNIGLVKTADSLPPPVSFPWPWANSVVTQHVGASPVGTVKNPTKFPWSGGTHRSRVFPLRKGPAYGRGDLRDYDAGVSAVETLPKAVFSEVPTP